MSNTLPETPYQKAKQEWDERIGTSVQQAEHWRFIAILLATVSLTLLGLLVTNIILNPPRLFIAEVSETGRVMNVAPLSTPYRPTPTQLQYFLAQWIKWVNELSLDPVVAKKNWISAYHFLTSRSSEQLTQYFREKNPTENLGKKTVTVTILDINPLSEQTFQINWTEKTVDNQGKLESQKQRSGTLTIALQTPKNSKTFLENPLGIVITDFHFSDSLR